MKKVILVLFIAIFCEATFAQDNSGPRRSSFYLGADLGANLTGVSYDHLDGTGLGTVAELTMGFLIKGVASLQGSIEIFTIDGEYDMGKNVDKRINNEIDAAVFLGGIGTTIFPFSRSQNSFLRGTFFGVKGLMGIALLNSPYESMMNTYRDEAESTREDALVLGMDLEIGKDWQISERFHMGIGRWQIIGIVLSDEAEYGDETDNSLMNSLQVVFRINRR